MGKEIIWNNINWAEGDDFLAFAFGDFNSKSFGEIIDNSGNIITPASYILRTSDGNRYNIHLAPPMQDKTADIPGGDGQYYFGTTHKPKVFDISFAFDNLTKSQIQDLKRAFNGKEMRELAFAEDCIYDATNGIIVDSRVYMAKVTSQPNIKTLCFDTDEGEKYKGEGTVQLTAYWPYCRNIKYVDNIVQSNADQGKRLILKKDNTTTKINLSNNGDIPSHFVFEVKGEAEISKLVFEAEESITTIEGEKITYWDSKTGIIKSGNEIIAYTGNGLHHIPVDGENLTITYKESTIDQSAYIKYYNWYY